MTGIDDTSKMATTVEGWAISLDAMSGGEYGPARIEAMERDGQQQLVHSDRLPTDRRGDFEALGFTFGEPDPDDPLFCPATLPDGWEKRSTDHSMGSVIVDPLGRERVSIFYKAAFYDRSAHMSLIGLSWYVTKHVEYDSPLVLDDKWATREAVAAAMREIRDGHLTEVAEFRGFASSNSRDEDNRRHCAEIADRKEAEAAKYDAALSQLAAQG